MTEKIRAAMTLRVMALTVFAGCMRERGRAGGFESRSCRRFSKRVATLGFGDSGPDSFRGRRHVQVTDAIGAPKRVENGVHDRRAGADRARFTRALDPQRIARARNIARLETQLRNVLGARQGVVHQAAADRLT